MVTDRGVVLKRSKGRVKEVGGRLKLKKKRTEVSGTIPNGESLPNRYSAL